MMEDAGSCRLPHSIIRPDLHYPVSLPLRDFDGALVRGASQ